MKRSVFTPSALVLLLASAIGLFSLSVLLHAYDNDPVATSNRTRPGSYSVSALGYSLFYDTMRRLDRPVSRSVGNTLAMVGPHGTLIVGEPELRRVGSSEGQRLLMAPRLLLVLPKWRALPDDNRSGWVRDATPAPLIMARQTLALVAGRSDVFRTRWPEAWAVNELGFAPSGKDVVQLIRSQEMRPVVGTDEGMLVGELIEEGRRIWVLSDPDLLANHGLLKGENAAFMVALIDALRFWDNDEAGARIVFDETVHGFQQAESSPLKLMFRFPFVIVTALVCAAAVLLALAATSRFGTPRIPPPPLDFGKAKLIDNSARLLDYGGHHALVFKRYVRMTVRSVARALHAPPNLDEPALAAWLDRIGKARGVEGSCAAILRAVNATTNEDTQNLNRLFDSVRDIHRWKGEILNGPSTRRHHR